MGYWAKCGWCNGTGRLWDVIHRTWTWCRGCVGLGKVWIEEEGDIA